MYSRKCSDSPPETGLWHPDVVHITGKKTAEEMTFSCWLQTHLSLLQGPEGDFGIPAGTLKSGRINPRLAVFEDAGPMPDPQRHRTQGCVRPGVAAGHLRWVAAGRVARGTRGSRPAWHGRTVPAAASEAASHWSREMGESTSLRNSALDYLHFLAFSYFMKPKLRPEVIPVYEWVKIQAEGDIKCCVSWKTSYCSQLWKKTTFPVYAIAALLSFYRSIVLFPPDKEQK